MATALSKYSDAFSRLHCNKRDGHYSPHKPVMLLAVMDLFELGEQIENKIRFEPLLESFAQYFEIVQQDGDKRTPINPYFFMKSEGFWHHKPFPGQEAVYAAMQSPPGISSFCGIVEHVYLDDDLFNLLCVTENREILRQTIINTYFSDHREELLHIIATIRDVGAYEKYLNSQVDGSANDEPDADEHTRDAAFSRIVREAYDFMCAACGLRVIIAESIAIVDAAHIVPFSITHDNDPRNGMALCKNHHWAMDRDLLAPGPDHKWHVSDELDKRIDGQRVLVDLNNQKVLLPGKQKYYPKKDSLEWRIEKLRKVS